MDRARGLRRHMAGNAARERELFEEALHALFVARNVGINLGVSTLEIGVRDQAGPTMAWSRDVDHVQIVLLDDPIQLNIDEVQSGRGPPMSEKPWLDVILGKWALQERGI